MSFHFLLTISNQYPMFFSLCDSIQYSGTVQIFDVTFYMNENILSKKCAIALNKVSKLIPGRNEPRLHSLHVAIYHNILH